MKEDLYTLYENMMMEPQILRVVRQTIPLPSVEAETGFREDEEDMEDEDLSEIQEVEIARDILSVVSDLDDLAKEAMYKSFRNKIEKCADKIRDLANEIIEGHGENI
jgi:hypothetical protein